MLSPKRSLPSVYQMGKDLSEEYSLGYQTFLGRKNPYKSLHAPLVKRWAQTQGNCLDIACAIAEKFGYSPASRSQSDMNKLWDMYGPGGKKASLKLRSPVNMLLYKTEESAKQGHVVLEAWGRKYNYGGKYYDFTGKVMRRIPLFPISNEVGIGLNLDRFFSGGKKFVASAMVGASLLTGGIANAANMVDVSKGVAITEKVRHLKYLSNYAAGLFETDLAKKTLARNILTETAIHESQRLEHARQVIKKDGKLVEEGRARSIFMIEPVTAKNLIHWAENHPNAQRALEKASGKSFKDLSKMSKDKLANLIMDNDRFAAVMARTKYLSVSGKIPATMPARAKYWADKYMAGKDKVKKAGQYIADNRAISRAMMKNINNGSKYGNASFKATKFMRSVVKKVK